MKITNNIKLSGLKIGSNVNIYNDNYLIVARYIVDSIDRAVVTIISPVGDYKLTFNMNDVGTVRRSTFSSIPTHYFIEVSKYLMPGTSSILDLPLTGGKNDNI